MCARSRVSSTRVRPTRATSAGPKLPGRGAPSLIEAPAAATASTTLARPPGRSEMRQVSRHRRPSAARPRSITRAIMLTSMLPPASTSATRLPSRPRPPASSAASGTAPAPSTTSFSSSSRRRMAWAMRASSTSTKRSTSAGAWAKAMSPAFTTARPSARVGRGWIASGRPARMAACMVGALSASTPMMRTFGLTALSATAIPVIEPRHRPPGR